MKLIELLVQETLSGKFKWPECCYALVQGSNGAVYLAGGGMPIQKFELAEDWELAEVTREQYEAALAADQPQWDGEGLPPVGCECEVRYRHGGVDWGRFKCIAVDSDVAFGWCADEPVTLLDDNYEFRPIRSEADKKRDEIAKQINAAADASGTLGHVIYDAIAAGKIHGLCIMY